MENNKENVLIEKIKNDKDFIKKCSSFGGVNCDDIKICKRYSNEPITIVVGSPNKDVFIFMDEDYNPIGIHRFRNSEEHDFYHEAYNYHSIYNYSSVFYNLRLCDIVNLAERVESISNRMLVNGEEVDLQNGNIYIGLLSYINFLGKKINNYFKELYKARLLGLEFPSLYSYVYSTICNIDDCINRKIEKNQRPWPHEILASIGENSNDWEPYYDTLYKVIDFILYSQGYQIGRGDDYLKLLPITNGERMTPEKSDELLSLLDVSKEEVEERFRDARNNLKFNTVNLEELLSGTSKRIK